MAASWAQPKPKRRRAIGLNSPRESTPVEGEEPVASTSTLAPKREPKRVRTSKPTVQDKYAPPDLRLSTLGGLHEQISQLMEIVVLPILHPEIYEWTGVPRPRGVLLHGVPGGGKTQLVKCLAGVSRSKVS
jgi:ribosome biogenesis ATPase